MGVLGVIGLAVALGLITSSRVAYLTDERETAKNLAESQMEYVKGMAFATSYTPQDSPRNTRAIPSMPRLLLQT